MNTSFYRAFEDVHRGPRELISQRLHVYLDFILPLTASVTPAAALDLGCGRGEWLELLEEQGFAAHGVDLDEGMLAACRERGLNVTTADALSCLKAHGDASLALVSAFHLVEHLPFSDVQTLITEAQRVLIPGGLLIMETPNPENLVVGTSSFYLDPSHVRPLPPKLLSFVTEHAGFARNVVMRLQESQRMHSGEALSVFDVLDGVSPDYAVVAQRAGDPLLLQRFDSAFGNVHGIDLQQLSANYEQRNEEQRAILHAGLANLEQRISEEQRTSAVYAAHAAHVEQVLQTLDQRTMANEEQRALLHAGLANLEQRITEEQRTSAVYATHAAHVEQVLQTLDQHTMANVEQRAILHSGLANMDQRINEEQRTGAARTAHGAHVEQSVQALDQRTVTVAAMVAELDRRSTTLEQGMQVLENDNAQSVRQMARLHHDVAQLELRIASGTSESARHIAELSSALTQSRHHGAECLREVEAATSAHLREVEAAANERLRDVEAAASARQLEIDNAANIRTRALELELLAAEEMQVLAASDLAVARRRAARAEALAAEAERVRAATADWAQGMEQTLLTMQASYTWRISKSIRALGQHSGVARLLLRTERYGRRVAGQLLVTAAGNESVHRLMRPWRRRFPTLNAFVTRTAAHLRGDGAATPPPSVLEATLLNLPRSARGVFDELSRSISHT